MTSRPKCLLEPIDLHSPDEFAELLVQRKLCGWNKEPRVLERWRQACDERRKALFWIIPAQLAEQPRSNDVRVGHIALQNYEDPPDPEIASEDKSVMTISTFFMRAEHRGGGLGRAAVEELEGWAKTAPYGSPGCKAVTVHTASRRYTEDDGEKWRGSWPNRGIPTPKKGSSVEDWYARMGYVKWKEQEGYYKDKGVDGSDIQINAVFMRKNI